MLRSKRLFLTAFIIGLLLPIFVLIGFGEASYASTTSSSASVSLWVTANNDSKAGSVTEINGSTGTVSHTITVGNFPDAIAVNSSGNVWVANYGSDTVSEINGSTGTVLAPLPSEESHSHRRGLLRQRMGGQSRQRHLQWHVLHGIGDKRLHRRRPSHHFRRRDPQAMAVDSSGNVWVANGMA